MKPEDFYFYCDYSQEYKGVFLFIVSIDYWDKYHRVDDQHLHIRKILPKGISEESESLFQSSKSIEETCKDMICLGFQENTSFSKFVYDADVFARYE